MYNLKMIEGQIRSLPECVHHWVIGPPKGLKADAFCKKCDLTRVFENPVDTKSDHNSKEMRAEVDFIIEVDRYI